MNFAELSPFWLFVLMLSSLVILVSQNWRYILIALAIQFVGVFGLIATIWPVSIAAVKVMVGWMTCSILGAARVMDSRNIALPVSERILRVITAGLVWVLVFTFSPNLVSWIAIPVNLARGSLLLIAMGLVLTGITRDPMIIIIGLLTLLSGFEIMYSYLEASILVTGLLAAVNLGIAFTGSIILAAPGSEESI